MCGILGWLGHGEEMRERGERALDLLTHRGPDAGALWLAPGVGAALGSRRLAILDLRREADQPMRSGSMRLVHNGEIYNFVELREELASDGDAFATTSDTEVMLRAFRRWGERAVERFNGMFAFGLWDENSGTLTLGRDRFGEKPLFYLSGPSCFHFASEIKALLQFPCASRVVDEPTLHDFLATGRVPDGSRHTFFAGINRLPPATLLHVDRDGRVEREGRYWQLAPDRGAGSLSLDDATAQLGSLLEDSVRIRLRSDVPVGTSLSGGIDSSLVATIVARLLDPAAPRQRTFSARHRAAAIDEGAFIAPVVAATRAQASEVWIDPHEVPDAIDRLVWHQDEPFPHTSMFAQWKVYELTRREGVTVLLDGQGADEIFGGYHSLAFGALWYGMLRRMDVRGLVDEIGAYRGLHGGSPSLPLRYIAAQGTPSSLQARARAMRWRSSGLVANLSASRAPAEIARGNGVHGSLHLALCAATLQTSLPGLLRFADRSSMAHSIEVRLPFLDHRVVEFAFGLPDDYLVHRGWSKRILRGLLRRDLPEIADRRDKIGFATPEGEWFRGPLRAWMTDLLTAAGRRDLFQSREVERMWQSVLAGRTPTQVAWRVANVELWLRRYVDASTVGPPDNVLARP